MDMKNSPNESFRRIFTIIKITVLVFFVLNILWYCYSAIMVVDISDKILAVNNNKDTFKLSEVTAFNWDYAYIDTEFRSSEDEPKPLIPLHPLYGSLVKSLLSGDRYIKFVKGNRINRIGYIPEFTIYFPDEIVDSVYHNGWCDAFKIKPDMVFEGVQEDREQYYALVLVLQETQQ